MPPTNITHTRATRELDTFDTQQPYQHCRYWEGLCIERPKFNREELRAALSSATLKAVSDHARRDLWPPNTPPNATPNTPTPPNTPSSSSGSSDVVLPSGWGQVLVQGNLDQAQAQRIVDSLEKQLPPRDKVPLTPIL